MAVVGTNPMTFEGPFTIVGGVTQELVGTTIGDSTTVGVISIDYYLAGTTIGSSTTIGVLTLVGPRRVARGVVGWKSSRRGVIDFTQGDTPA